MILIIPLVIIVGILAWILRPGKTATRSRKFTALATIIPVLVISIAAVIFQLIQNANATKEVSNIANACFVAGVILIVAYILTAIGFALAHKSESAKGIGFGICIAVAISVVDLGLLEWLGGG
jgi:hypothetical protein